MQINQLPAASSLNNQDKFAVDTTDGITKSITASQLVELTRTNSYGAPLAAGTAAAMTDTSKVYVYTGNETGYTNGDWYYYNGTAWVSGGAYNSVAVNTDKTLRLSGVAADAKAVGDANAALEADILTVSGDLEEATEKIYSDIATDYDNLTWPVSAGQYCIYLGRTYKANQDIPTIESWNASHWTRTNLGDGLSDLGDVPGDIAGLQAAIASEASARQAADTSLNNAISAEASAREATDTALNGSIIAEATAREAADNELKSAIAHNANWQTITWTDGKYIGTGGGYITYSGCSSCEIPLAGIKKVRFTLISVKTSASYCTKTSNYSTKYYGYEHTPTFEWVEHTVAEDEAYIRISCDTNQKDNFLFFVEDTYDENVINTLSSSVRSLQNAIKSQFNVSDFENGKYSVYTGRSGSSAANIVTPTNTTYSLLGIRNTNLKYNGYLRNINDIKEILSSGTVYMYLIGAEYNDSTGQYDNLGYYNYKTGEWTTDESSRIYVTQVIDVASLRKTKPTLQCKLCIVDTSTNERADIASTLSNVSIYYVVSPQTLDAIVDDYDAKFTDIFDAIGTIPAYYNTMLVSKANRIIQNMEEVGQNGFTFAFITDMHWDNNAKKSPLLLREILRRTNVTNVVCGGDLIAEGTKEYASETLMACINAYKKRGVTFPVCVGNHDRNWNPYGGQREHPERKLSDNAVWALIEAQYDKYSPIRFNDWGINYYIDYPITNTRLIFVDTGDTRDVDGTSGIFYTDYEGYADALMQSGNKNIIIIAHAVDTNSIGTRLCRIANHYNNRALCETSYLTYDFSKATGHVYVVIGGHGHVDNMVTPTEGGISWIMTDCDALISHTTTIEVDGEEVDFSPVIGTVTEQAFDVVTVNFNTGMTKCVRIGRGVDRQI